MTLAMILPPRINGLPVDYMPEPSGAVTVAFWKDDGRDEGILVPCDGWAMVRRLIADVQRRVPG